MYDLLPYTLRTIPLLNRFAVIPINFIAIALLLTIISQTKLKDSQSKIFVLMGVSMLLWVDFAYLARLFGLYPDISETFLRIAWLATPMVFYCTYWLSVHIMKVDLKYKLVSSILLVITLATSIVTAFTDLIITGVKFTDNTLDIIYGIGLYPFLIIIFLMIVFTFLPLITTKLEKQAKIFLLGVLVFYIANGIFNITLPIFLGITHYYYFGDYSTIFLLFFTMYAIVKDELFDVKSLATEMITILLWSVMFSKLFVTTELAIDLAGFILMVGIGILLIRSVRQEVSQRTQLAVLNVKLKDLDARKNEFLNIVAHELRAPMTAIKGYISMLLDGDAGQLSEEATDYLNVASKSNDRLIRMVNNLLNISRIEEGREVYQMGVVSLLQVIKSNFDEFRFTAEEKHLRFVLDIGQIPPPDRVYVDKDRIFEVVANFISNSIKYTESGTVLVKVYNPQPDRIRMEVSDTGRGIAPADQVKLFQKFYRVETSMRRTVGTGLGLYISKLLVEKFGGRIGFVSQEGKGSTFWFELPLVANTELKPNILV